MQSIGNLDESEMYRTFNMGIGLVLIVPPSFQKEAKEILGNFCDVFKIGRVIEGDKKVHLE